MRIATPFGDGDGHLSQLVFPDALAERGPEESIAQQFNYSMLSDARASAIQLTLARSDIVRVTPDGLREVVQPPVFNRDGLNYWRSPAVGPLGDGEERLKLSLR